MAITISIPVTAVPPKHTCQGQVHAQTLSLCHVYTESVEKKALMQLQCTMQGGLNTGICHSITKDGYVSFVMEVSLKPPAFSFQCLHTTIPVSRAKFKPESAGILQDILRTIQILRSHMHTLQTVSLLWDVGFCLGLFAREALGWHRESNIFSCG